MFGALFLKECKNILKSLVYYVYVIILVLFLSSQISEIGVGEIKEPEKGQDYYGTVISLDKKDIMERTLADLFQETNGKSYATYPMGFYKSVILSDSELSEIKEIIEDISGEEWSTLEQQCIDHYGTSDPSEIDEIRQVQASYRIPVKDGYSYKEFCNKMERVCSIIGKGARNYEKELFETGVRIPGNYETKMAEYRKICKKDQVTGAYMRLFCDYAGIILSVLPIFLGVTRCLKDKRSKVSQVIYARNAGTGVIIGSRYLANVCMAFLPVVVVSFILQLPWQYHAQTLGVQPDLLAFLKYDVLWLLPEIMIVMAAAFLITEMTENVIAVFIQVFWAVISLFSANTLIGNFGWKLVARWNIFGAAGLFQQQKMQFYSNRGFYFALSLILLALTFVVYEKKRKEGETLYGKIFKRRK